MIVMPSNVTGTLMDRLAAEYPGQLQHLIGPGGWRTPVLPYALDNGAWGAFKNQTLWSAAAYLDLCDRAAACASPPLWVAVPDVVTDWPATLRSWSEWAPRLRQTYGWDLAVCVQDGARVEEAQNLGADVVFVGGRSRFKWSTLGRWVSHHTRVHVGRVNNVERALVAKRAGVESIDGTGWMMTDRQRGELERLLGLLRAGHRVDPGAPPLLWPVA